MNAIAASRYAKSVLHFALEKRKEDLVKKDMIFISETLEKNKNLQKILKNPSIKAPLKIKILETVFKGISEITQKLIPLLVAKKRLDLIKIIADKYVILYQKNQSISIAYVTTAVPLEEHLEKKLKNKIKKLTQKNIEIKNKVDKNILGGYIFQVGDLQCDNSILGTFEKLKRSLN